ncbi:DNA-directed DNA polymerase [Enterococcus florum]|uniref:DNA polymerase III subunit alpha n=1 Tax=Enterococcus florum TaxID=2480627 RepID=A0A4P5PG50_9ENTE|nr:DNA polymerase III subunit alpha [Enterococcus florum]GCF95754.1 DNA-directed DNA polymerase [Enterococcus florum]
MKFPQLYTKTSYSLLKSTLTIEEYVRQAQERGYQFVAITDEHVLYGAVEFYQTCKKYGLNPIIGMELDYESKVAEEAAVLLYAKNYEGYQELMRLSSKRMIDEQRCSIKEYQINSTHLAMVLPASPDDSAESMVQKVKEMKQVGPVYVACSPEREHLSRQLEQQNVSLLALHQVQYLQAADAFVIEVMEHIQEGSQIGREELVAKQGALYLAPEEEQQRWFQDNRYTRALENAERLAMDCQFELPLHQKLLPHYPVEGGDSAQQHLEKLCWQKLSERVSTVTQVYKDRLTKELSIIHRMGFDDYFLIVWDVMDYAHRNKIVTGAGRGSAAGSLVAYVLAITDVDPIEYELLFERFLNPERNNMPDIDLDIPDNRRNEILHYVKEKYGRFHVAQIATFGTMAAKMVLRDVGRVFGLSQSEANRWSKAIPNRLKITLKEAFETSESLRQLVHTNPRSQLLFDTALILEGLPRHVSTHAAGVVISDQELISIVPLQNGSEDILLTQFTMNAVETIGLLKMDFLGLRNLSIIDKTLKNIQRVTGERLDLKQISLNDPQTLALFQRGETTGVFQFESAGIRNVLRKLGPTSIEDIAAVNALYRPGPMQNIDHFIARKKGKEPINYPETALQPILENTYGIIVYQEQIMQVAAKMAGFSLGQADILRRAISKKKKEVLDQERNHFVSGALEQGYSKESANRVYDYIERFANYGFNRSHAFAYSFVGYQMAYLKVHYPGPFYTALLQSVRNDPKKMREYIAEAKKVGVRLLAPDINKSSYSFTLIKENLIRFGLDAIKGIRRDFVAEILSQRSVEGPYTSLDNFLLRIEPRWLKEEYVEPLILVGAFDHLDANRHKLQDGLEGKIQNVLYSGGSISLLDVMSLKEQEITDYTLAERLDHEERYLGLYVSGHPTESFPALLKTKGVRAISEVVVGENVQILFYLKELREIRTKKGEQMAFLTGNDQSGEISLTVFPQLYRRKRDELILDKVYLVKGKVERSRYDQTLQLLVEEIESADAAEEALASEKETLYLRVSTQLDSKELHMQIAERLRRSPGNVPVVIYFEKDRRKIVLDKDLWIGINEELLADLRDIIGDTNLVIR